LIRILVSAKSAIVRAGLESVVGADSRFEVVGNGYRHGDALRAAREYAPDVVLLETADISTQALASMHQPGAPAIVLLLDSPTRNELRRLLTSGVRAILPRDAAPQEITATIEAASNGLAVLSQEFLELLLPAASANVGEPDLQLGEPLTSRESEVLSMMAEGAGNKEIAARLKISEHTVKFHVSAVLAKLGAATRTEAVSRGYREGLIVL
jgi:NarL family two-component system response regulator YdfI